MPPPTDPLVLVSGFGAFESVELNPSGEIAKALAHAPPRGLRVAAAVLPVSFERAPRAWDDVLAACGPPAFCLGLGVAKRPGFRLERWAKPVLKHVPRPDVDGRLPAEFSRAGTRLEAGADLPRLLAALVRRGVADMRISRTAGGYVCERVYHHLLQRAGELGVPGLFVHVPPLRYTALERQEEVLRWLLDELFPADGAPQSSSSRRG